nr:PREDICTED: protein eyes shut isoform X1 [Tribolium castaneum]XP_015835341.1 PREDICTED: protein eyes shut isoform X1 [Tribolium castaneum]|eukprot:XP_015835340.1 PREDICTED: protein eyes shut isoform X1 [Tribolium castaneum]
MPSVGSAGRSLFLLLAPFFLLPLESSAGLACLSNPCVHGVCLDDLNSTYFCYCIDGYTGIQCQKNWNECWSSPCKNGGICIDGVASFNCSCPPGFVGTKAQSQTLIFTKRLQLGELCEEDFNECESNPCLNNGTCLDAANGYFCSCLPGYSGVHCEVDVAVCNATNETRCANGGICVEGPGDSFSCKCQPGWEGLLCEGEVDECMSAPCQNGAVCVDLMADYSCACLFGFSGRNCEDTVKICDVNPCANGALCLKEDRQPVCYCVPDFHGDLCQFQYDECQLGPKCMNGGTCVDGIDNSTCSCPPNLTGVQCECLILDNGGLDCTYTSPQTVPPIRTSTIFHPTTTETEVPNTTTVQPFSTTIAWTTTEVVPPTTTYTQTQSTTELTETILVYSTTPKVTEMSVVTTETEPTTETTYSTVTTTEIYTEPVFTTTTGKIITTMLSTETSSFPPVTTFLPMTSTPKQESNFSLPDETTTSFFTKKPETTTALTAFFTETTTKLLTDTTVVPFDCTKTHCQNGGTCVYKSELGYQCLCPFHTEGDFCELKMGVQKAAFTGQSYLKHRLPDSTNISIELDAKTLSSKGLLFYSNTDSTYMVLYIENGHLKFKFSCGYQTMLLSELKVPVNNGDLMKIKAKLEFSKDLKRCDASIKVNDSLSMTGDQLALKRRFSKPSGWLYLGGVPEEIANINLPESGFVGCMLRLKISQKFLDIFNDAEDGYGVTECSSLACLSNPCSNGATCYSHGEKWTCHCKNGFLGKMCEKSVCDTNPCLFGGTCIQFSGSGYICLCPFGKHGHFCENDLKITEPNFASTIRGLSSYVAYPIPGGISENMEIRFRFLPTVMDQISLLMFMGQKGHHNYYSDHMAVSFVKGYIMLTWNLGSGPRRIFTPQPIDEGAKNYQVRVGRSGRRAWLDVENLGNVTGRSPGNLIQLDVSPVLYLGGHDSLNFSTLPHDLPLHTGFSGCIFDVELITGNLVIPLQGSRQTIGRGVGQCGTTECYEQSCQNGGICLHHASTFMCLCQDGWFGPLCTFRRNPCDSDYHKCEAGATCVPVISDYECDCPIGKSGKFCEKDEDITDVNFTGLRSFLSLPPTEFSENHFNIEMEIRPLGDNGLLFFIEKPGSSFISLTLSSGSLELRILSYKNKAAPNEPTTIRSTKILIKGIWYKIQLGIFGKKAYLSVDNIINSAVLSTENGINMSKENIFIGGHPDISTLPLLAVSKLPVPYKGCIRAFSANGVHIPLNKMSILSGRNINDCDGTPCGKDACLNGGTCWLDSFMKPHCSCPPAFYGNKCQSVSECDTAKCKTTGVCVGPKCSCHLGWEGVYCERQIKVTTPEFTGRSYLIVKKNNEKKRNTPGVEVKTLYLNFTTVKKDGLVLWSRKENSFVGMGLENGFLKIAYSVDNRTGTNLVTLPLSYKISDGLWHNIELSFAPFLIKLDQNKIVYNGKNKKMLENSTMSTDGLFYIGGIPTKTTIKKETNGTFLDTFEGCIEGFATNGEQVIRDFTPFEGRDVNVCRVV